MCTLERAARLSLCVARRRALPSPHSAQRRKFGQPIAPADLAPWDISIGPDGAGLPPGTGTAAQGEAVYAAQVPGLSRRKGRRPPERRAGRRHRHAQGRQAAGEDGRQLLAVCHDAVRLRPPRDAVQRVAIADHRRDSTRCRPISSISTGSSGRRRARRPVAAEGEDAEPRWIHSVPAITVGWA